MVFLVEVEEQNEEVMLGAQVIFVAINLKWDQSALLFVFSNHTQLLRFKEVELAK